MSWRDGLLPASFRSAPFFVQGAEGEGGRRILTHVFPLRDDHEHEDLGANPEAIRVEAYVLGEDHLQARDLLLSALRTPGPGVLVLPRGGRQRVRLLRWRFREETREAGITYLALTFERAPDRAARPSRSRASRLASVSRAAALVDEAASEAFVEALGSAGVTGDSATAIGEELGGFANLLESLGIGTEVAAAASFLRRVQRLADNALGSLDNPGGLAGELQGIVRDLVDGTESRLAAFDAYRSLIGFRASDRRTNSPQAAQVASAGEAVATLARAAAVNGAAGAAAAIEWPSRPDALAALGTVTQGIDELGPVVSDAVFAALGGLRAVMAEALPGTEAELPRLERIELAQTEPALVIAQRLYGRVDEVPGLLTRNAVKHPGFVPGGTQLEVVARDA